MRNNQKQNILMVDIGGVLYRLGTHGKSLNEMLEVATLPNAIEVLSCANEILKGNVHFVTRLLPHRESIVLAWFKYNEIQKRTGIKNLTICRAWEDKGLIYKKLQANIVIDDEPLVHKTIMNQNEKTRPKLYAFGCGEPNYHSIEEYPKGVIIAKNWSDMAKMEGWLKSGYHYVREPSKLDLIASSKSCPSHSCINSFIKF